MRALAQALPDLASLITPVGAAIAARHVSHRFDLGGAALPVIEDLSVEIEPSSLVALLGPSGCGKSTLLRLIAGLEPPTEGQVTANGLPIDGPDPSRVVVFQDPTLFPWRSVRDNVGLGLEAQRVDRGERQRRIDGALRLVGLSNFASAYPHQLSGGMAQRVALARAIVNQPSVLILDEPLGKLDSLTRIAMQAELVGMWHRSGFTAIMVTHDVEEALFMAERVLVLSDRPARIVADLQVDLPYPRHRGDPRLAELRRRSLSLLGLDATW